MELVCPNGHPVPESLDRPCDHCNALVIYEPAAIGLELHRQLRKMDKDAITLEVCSYCGAFQTLNAHGHSDHPDWRWVSVKYVRA